MTVFLWLKVRMPPLSMGHSVYNLKLHKFYGDKLKDMWFAFKNGINNDCKGGSLWNDVGPPLGECNKMICNEKAKDVNSRSFENIKTFIYKPFYIQALYFHKNLFVWKSLFTVTLSFFCLLLLLVFAIIKGEFNKKENLNYSFVSGILLCSNPLSSWSIVKYC